MRDLRLSRPALETGSIAYQRVDADTLMNPETTQLSVDAWGANPGSGRFFANSAKKNCRTTRYHSDYLCDWYGHSLIQEDPPASMSIYKSKADLFFFKRQRSLAIEQSIGLSVGSECRCKAFWIGWFIRQNTLKSHTRYVDWSADAPRRDQGTNI